MKVSLDFNINSSDTPFYKFRYYILQLCCWFFIISSSTILLPCTSFLLPKPTGQIRDKYRLKSRQQRFHTVVLNDSFWHHDDLMATAKVRCFDTEKFRNETIRKWIAPKQQQNTSLRIQISKMIVFLITILFVTKYSSCCIGPVHAMATFSSSSTSNTISRVPATALSQSLGTKHIMKAAGLVLFTSGVGLSILSCVPIVSREVLKACLRSSLQLMIFGSTVLTHLFITGQTRPWLVGVWIAFTALIAANEAYNRVEYSYPQLPYHLVLAFLLGGGFVISATAALRILGPVEPWYTPRVWIPVAGMMLGNALTGTALAAKTITKELATNFDQIELRLTQGASWREAMQIPIQSIYSSSLTPLMNFLSAAGIVHVPGLMTGQILAGQSPVQAATYQMLVFMLMTSTTCTSVQILIRCAIASLVDQRNDRLQLSSLQRIKKPIGRKRNNMISFLSMFPKFDIRAQIRFRRIVFRKASNQRPLKRRTMEQAYLPHMPIYSVVLQKELMDTSLPLLSVNRMRVARTNMDVTFDVKPDERMALTGKSGIGKSQVLRTLIGLESVDRNSIQLHNCSAAQMPMSEWRSHIVLVPQKRPSLEGTPNDFYRQVIKFKSQSSKQKDVPFISPMEYCKSWGIPASMLDRPWSKLSGGESQRIVLAIALAQQPDVLLLDESTSALDEPTELLVEATLKKLRIPIILVSHSGKQVERFCNRRLNLERIEVPVVQESTQLLKGNLR